ncbi:DUF58 domain-containing protein [Entomomonas asaccharolytica]|uniref:DUF58 domain-containing protein n=1 Tax=Entomomonas asaccharolytica TaxID=2785331 RepID=A0A974NDV0_9GAMM|nr:DUF58 domain-containing protein [Entomomonas asaccharolytica]QQP84868.1 DUF58 domain-containing protein [Entomomonas asaccharolytica]
MAILDSLTNTPNVEQGVHTSLEELLNMRYHLKGLSLFSANNRRSPLVGSHHSKLRGRGIDFDQVRIYLPGDDIRSIDWRVTARSQQAHTKIFHEEKERPVFLLVEQTKHLFLGTGHSLKSVITAQLASLLGWAALDNNDRIGGLVFNESEQRLVRPRLSKHSLLQFIGYLQKMNAQLQLTTNANNDNQNNTLLHALKQSKEALRPGSLLFIIVDERSLTEDCLRILQSLAIHLDIVLLPVYDPLDHELPRAGLLRFAQNDRELVLDTNNNKLRAAYAQQAIQRQQRWQELAKKIMAKLLPINTELDVVEQIKPLLMIQR